jgi:hypothetical protein
MATIVARTGPTRFRPGPPGKQAASVAVRTWEVAIVGVGPDDSWENRDETQTEDVGLPDHEGDEGRRQPGTAFEDDAAEVANMSDSGLSESGLPAHEDDRRMTEDTGSGEQNP